MNLTLFAVLLVLCGPVLSRSKTESYESNNEISPKKPPVRLDPTLRRALLRALEDLERQSAEEELESSTISQTTESPISTTPTFQKTYHVHAFSDNNTQNSTSFVPADEDINFNVRPTTRGQFNGPIIPTVPDPLDDRDFETINTSASSNIDGQSARSIKTPTYVKNTVPTSEKPTTRQAPTAANVNSLESPQPTVATSEEEVDNEFRDEDAVAKVEDVQFFPAPLVAAFTVHQDEGGLPHSVVPIYKPTVAQKEQREKQKQQLQKQQSIIKQQQQQIKTQQQLNVQQQLNLQRSLEEKQRQLEQQLFLLREQQRQQEQLLKQQQLFQEQQLLQARQRQIEQQFRYEDDQRKRQQQPLDQQNNFSNNKFGQFSQPQVTKAPNPNTVVSLQPSISFTQPPSLREQQPPNKEAVDFLANIRQQQTPFPLQQNHVPSNFQQLPPPVNNFPVTPSFSQPSFNNFNNLRPNTNNNFNNFRPNFNNNWKPNFNNNPQPSFNNIQPFNNNPQSYNNNNFQPILNSAERRPTRVFRHNIDTANFGFNAATLNNDFAFNNNGASLVSFSSLPPPQRTVDKQLKNLLFQQGIGQGRTQEDLNIVSKVLSLNHFGGPRL